VSDPIQAIRADRAVVEAAAAHLRTAAIHDAYAERSWTRWSGT
jgi:hypothetical protein